MAPDAQETVEEAGTQAAATEVDYGGHAPPGASASASDGGSSSARLWRSRSGGTFGGDGIGYDSGSRGVLAGAISSSACGLTIGGGRQST